MAILYSLLGYLFEGEGEWMMKRHSSSPTHSQHTLKDTVQSYYDHRFTLSCGIVAVTLRDSPEDFQQVIDRINERWKNFPDFNW